MDINVSLSSIVLICQHCHTYVVNCTVRAVLPLLMGWNGTICVLIIPTTNLTKADV